MADAALIAEVKKARGMTGTFAVQDEALAVDIDEIIGYLVAGGVPETVANSTAAAGAIARGIEDIKYNNGNLSTYFYQRLGQLALRKTPPKEVATDEL